MRETILFKQIRPFVRYAQLFTVTENLPFLDTKAYDHRLFYVVDGFGAIRTDGVLHAVEKGCLLIWQAGVPYDLTGSGEEGLTMIGCNFDYTQAHGDLTEPIPPAKTHSFREEELLSRCVFPDAPFFDGQVFLADMYGVEETLRQIYDHYQQQRLFSADSMSGLLLSVISDAARAAASGGAGVSGGRIDEILSYIRLHYNKPLTNRRLGERFHYHPNYINQLMVAHTGLPLHRYVLHHRIREAVHLLQTSRLSTAQIAETVGFCDCNYFLRYFKKIMGRTTREFRP